MSSYNDNSLDTQVNTEMMRVCKCVIPYLDRDIQKSVAVGLKFLELMNTINIYGDSTPTPDLSLMRQGNWEEDLLHSVRSNLSPEKAYLIDALMKLKEFRSIVQTKDTSPSFNLSHSEPESPPSFYNDIEPTPKNTTQKNSSSPANLLQMLSPLLDDNQRQMLNLLSTFLGPNK